MFSTTIIDNSQFPNWHDVLSPVTVDLSATFGGQNFGVTAFAGGFVQAYNPNAITWGDIDLSQNPGWVGVVT